MRIDPRTWGFRQARPKEPGVYFIIADAKHQQLRPLDRLRDGWEIAHVYWEESGYGSREPREDGSWRIHTLGGLEYQWVKGTWLKGPIDPTVVIQKGVPSNGRGE